MSLPIQANNPAGRLFLFLERAKALSCHPSATLGQQLLRLFPDAKGADDYFTFIHKATCVIGLVEEIKLLLSVYDQRQLSIFAKAEPTLKGFAQIVPLQQNWPEFANKWIRPSDLTALEFASLTLEQQAPEAVVSVSEIDAIKGQLSDLDKIVKEASIPLALKVLIFASISDITVALSDYELRGAQGLDFALSSVLGRALMHSDLAPTEASSGDTGSAEAPCSMEWQTPFWELISRIAQAIHSPSMVNGLLSLIAGTRKALPSPVGQSETTNGQAAAI